MNKELDNKIKDLNKMKDSEHLKINKCKQEILEAKNKLKKIDQDLKPLLKLKREEERFNQKVDKLLKNEKPKKNFHQNVNFPENVG